MQLTISFEQQAKMNAETKENSNADLYLMIIMVKLAVLCLLKLIKLCNKGYKKHNEVILKNNFTKYIDIEKGKKEESPKQSTSRNETH